MKYNHGCFGFSKESLKVEIFFIFFWFFILKDFIFLFSSSRPSHLRNSTESTEFYRVLTDSINVLYIVSVSMQLGLSRLRIDRVVLNSTDFLNSGTKILPRGPIWTIGGASLMKNNEDKPLSNN